MRVTVVSTNMSHTHSLLCVLAGVCLLSLASGCDDTPQPTTIIDTFKLSLGYESACMLKNGEIRCWGEGSKGEIGDSFGADSATPQPLFFENNNTLFVDVASGYNHSCAVTEKSAIYCWGANNDAALGNNTTTAATAPVQTKTLDGATAQAKQIAVGSFHSCALSVEDIVYCWGYSGSGQVGVGNFDLGGGVAAAKTPQAVSFPVSSPPISIAVGYTHSCAVHENGALTCWGSSSLGQLGNECVFNSTDETDCDNNKSSPTVSPFFDSSTPSKHALAVAAGRYHTCVVSLDRRLYCFGYNNDGQLGIGSVNSYTIPQLVGSLPDFVQQIALGERHSCALLQNGDLYCFGNNTSGQLGNSSTANSLLPKQTQFTAYTPLPTIVGIAAGGSYSCAWDNTDAIYCWGANNKGQFGTGETGGIRIAP